MKFDPKRKLDTSRVTDTRTRQQRLAQAARARLNDEQLSIRTQERNADRARAFKEDWKRTSSKTGKADLDRAGYLTRTTSDKPFSRKKRLPRGLMR